MIDFHKYKHAMQKAHEAIENAATVVNRTDLSSQEREKISKDLLKKADRFKAQAMLYAKPDDPDMTKREARPIQRA